MFPRNNLSPAIASGLGHCVSLLAKRVVRELPMPSSSGWVNAASPSAQRAAAPQFVLLQADIYLRQGDISSADRIVQQSLQRLSSPPNASFLRQPEPWMFLARLGFLRGDPQDAQTFLNRSTALVHPFESDRPVKPADKHGRALHCCQSLLQSILHAHDGAVQAAWQAFNRVESESQISDGPDSLRSILLTRCILELHQDQFVAAWRAYQAADLLRATSGQSGLQATPGDRAERMWLRQLASLQHPAECN